MLRADVHDIYQLIAPGCPFNLLSDAIKIGLEIEKDPGRVVAEDG
jgi:hypothetical protein